MTINTSISGLIILLLLTGCTASRFTCGKFPGAGCKPVTSVYDETNGELTDYRRHSTLSSDARSYVSGNPESSNHRPPIKINIGRASQAINHLPPGAPLLTKPVTMRILVNTYIDEENDLNTGGYVYIKLRESEWFNQ